MVELRLTSSSPNVLSNTKDSFKSENINVTRISERRIQEREEDESNDILESNDSLTEEETTWANNKDARSAFFTSLTGYYCLFLTITALILEMARLLSQMRHKEEGRIYMTKKDIAFSFYMYGMSLVFFAYLYGSILLNPKWLPAKQKIKSWLTCCRWKNELPVETIRKVTHTSPSTGSLFLRLGCVVFGLFGIVYYALMSFLCFYSDNCANVDSVIDILAVIFIFTQMHFIFCNWKLSITTSDMITRLGTMHLVAVNLWTWIRYILMEEGDMEDQIKYVFDSNSSLNRTYGEIEHNQTGVKLYEHCDTAECILGDVSEIINTAIVEYSLIGAAVLFIVWRNIGRSEGGIAYVKRKHQMRIDCSHTTTGLFLGLAFLAGTFTSIILYYTMSADEKTTAAAYVYATTDILQHFLASIGCGIAIYKLSYLPYTHKRKHEHTLQKEQELLDQILLSIGLIGELLYCIAALIGLTGSYTWQPLNFLLLIVPIVRLTQVALQTFLLYLASKVRIASNTIGYPGKQAITFLLAANLAIFILDLLESEKAATSQVIIDFYGRRSWVFLVRSFSPLTIFYRFHSSACFAEIWKNVYARRKDDHNQEGQS